MLTSLSFLSAERKSAPDYSPETRGSRLRYWLSSPPEAVMNLLRNGLLMLKTKPRRRNDLTEKFAFLCGLSAEFITLSNERPLLEDEPLSLCSDLLRFSLPIPTVSSEGQKSKIFRDTPRSLCRRILLFTEVPGETVWKIGEGLSARLSGGKRRPNSDFFDPSWPLSEPPFGTDSEFPNSFGRRILRS
jgi:hypothetical protein